jgi:hypothetical protein
MSLCRWYKMSYNDYMIKYIKKILPNKFDMNELGIVYVILWIKLQGRLMDWYSLNLIMLKKFSIIFLKMTMTLSNTNENKCTSIKK